MFWKVSQCSVLFTDAVVLCLLLLLFGPFVKALVHPFTINGSDTWLGIYTVICFLIYS